MNDKPQFVAIKVEKGEIAIHAKYTVYYDEIKEEGHRISCAIPAFDVYFSVDDHNKIPEKSRKIISMYMDHFMIHGKNKLKDFVLQIHKLGFVAPKDSFVIKSLLDKHDINAKFRSQKLVDESLLESKTIEAETEFAF